MRYIDAIHRLMVSADLWFFLIAGAAFSIGMFATIHTGRFVYQAVGIVIVLAVILWMAFGSG